jgi:hypothetical protein
MIWDQRMVPIGWFEGLMDQQTRQNDPMSSDSVSIEHEGANQGDGVWLTVRWTVKKLEWKLKMISDERLKKHFF